MLWIDPRLQPLCTLADFFQCRFKSSQFFRVHIGKRFPDFRCMFAENRRDQFFAFCRERHDADAPILGALAPAYEAPIEEAVNGGTDRAGRKVHLWADRIHCQRPSVEKHFQYSEVGLVDSCLLKSCIKIIRGRVERLHQYQPTVNRVSRVFVHDKTILFFYITDVQYNVSISIYFKSIDDEKERYMTYGNDRQEAHRGSRRNGAAGRRCSTRTASRQSFQGTRPDSQSGQASGACRRSR